MAGRKSKKQRNPLAKDGMTVGIRLSKQEEADLIECARLEGEHQGKIVHEAPLLRELGMPRVRERLAELRAAQQQPEPAGVQ